MYSRHLGFLLLLWIPEALHAQRDRLPCAAPTLNGGVLAPQKTSYPHGMTLVYNCNDGYKAAVDSWWAKVRCLNGRWSHTPQCTSYGSSAYRTGSQISVSLCGSQPVVAHGVVVEADRMHLKYQCNTYYKLWGPEKVMCHGDGMWTEIPTCEDNYCVVDTDANPELKNAGVTYLKEGQNGHFECALSGYYTFGKCHNGQMGLSKCCTQYDVYMHYC
ncbi:complement factor H-related protein 4-like [Antennarius striatus]|uniref:complement factor H-related protein 4-like n=1 Tax=Antennarius striatus TaxID=241820 RepID=UPI0035B2E390